ncbi:MAG: DNA polymerase III subunit delta [Hyphomonadaceae bacterium]|nr:DNA polymerase III subunit delta [Hyphomonadaceae bacterium]
MKIQGAAARRFLDKPDPQLGAALVFGPNRSLVADAAAAIVKATLKRAANDPFALSKLNEDEMKRDAARLADALAAQSLLGGSDARLVWARVEGSGADDAILAALADIEKGAPLAYLLVEGGDLGGTSKLAKAFEGAKRAAALVFYEESDAERAQFARDMLKGEGVTLSAEAAETLNALLPADRALMRREIEKLAAYANGAALSVADVELLVADEGEAELDQAALAALEGRAAAAMEALARIERMNGVASIKALTRRLMRLLEARLAVDEGASASDAAQRLRPPVFWKERDAFQAQLRVWSAPRLTRGLDVLWKAEIACKQAQSPQDMIAADAFAKVAALAGGR